MPSEKTDSADTEIFVGSIYGARTRQGLVRLVVGAEDLQVLPAKAREVAAMLVEAATAAEGDEVLMRVLDRAGMSPQRAAQVLLAMRSERQMIERRARAEAARAFVEDQHDEDAPPTD